MNKRFLDKGWILWSSGTKYSVFIRNDWFATVEDDSILIFVHHKRR